LAQVIYQFPIEDVVECSELLLRILVTARRHDIFTVVFLSDSKKMLRYYLKIDHYHISPNSFTTILPLYII